MSDDKSSDWGNEMDREEHLNTYRLFLTLGKWSIIVVSVILLFLLLAVYH